MRNKIRNFNFLMFAAMLALIAIGTIAIYSAGSARELPQFHSMWSTNLWVAFGGIILYFVFAFIDYRKILELLSAPGYVVTLVMLIAVLIIGKEIDGGKRWLFFFQPSELSKLSIIMVLSWLLGGNFFQERGFGLFMICSALIGIPVLLILAEPDLGTALTLVPTTLLMLLIGRVWRWGLVVMLTLGTVVSIVIVGAVYEAEKPDTLPEKREQILKYLPLREHQVKRIKVFLFPEDDLHGAAYNLHQSKLAIGSGGYSGKSLGQGEVNNLHYLPRSVSMNDFIFCVWAEDMGYIGSLVLLVCFGLLILPGVWVAYRSRNGSGRLLAIGLSTLIFVHVYINIGMTIGLVPITGLPLPFISSARTFLLTIMIGLGMVQSVSIHRED